MVPSVMALLGTALLASAAAASTQQLDEIVVTGSRVGETRLQDTPMPITAITGDIVERTNITTIRDIVMFTPNLSVAENSGFGVVSIRGIGSSNVFAGSDPSTTVHIDGVYIARPFAQFFNFLDVERIEVLRGPQGTLYGRNSVGGTINVISRRPSDEFTGAARMTVGTYGLLQPEIMLSGQIVPGRTQASIAAMHRQHDPYRKNIAPGAPDIENDDSNSARGQLRIDLTDRLDATTRVDYYSHDIRPSSFSKTLAPFSALTDSILGDFSRIAHNFPSRSQVRLWGIAEDISYAVNDATTLRSLTAYRENRIEAEIDSDATELDLLRSTPFEDQSQWSQELTLSGRTERVTYVAGGYFLREDVQERITVQNIGAGVDISFAPRVKTTARAAFFQGTYHLSDTWAATAGVRYTVEDKKIDQDSGIFIRATGDPLPIPLNPSVYTARDTYRATTPKFGLEYRPTDDLLYFATAARGFKSGGFDNTGRNPDQGFDSEDLWNYELGAKAALLQRRLMLNIAAFHYDYKNLQVQVAIAPGISALTNAASVEVNGVELELSALPADTLEIGLMAAYLDAKYERYENASLLGQVFDASGRRLGAPKSSYGLYIDKHWPLAGGGEVFSRADAFWRSRTYSLHDDIPHQPAYGLVNANVGYRSADDRWDVTLWGRNLFDKEYVTSITTFTATFAGRPGEPRNFGVRFAYRF